VDLKHLSLVYSWLISQAIKQLTLYLNVKSNVTLKPSYKNSKNLIDASLNGGFKNVGSFLLKKGSQIILQKYIGFSALGIYEVILKVYRIVDQGQQIFIRSYIPEIKKDFQSILSKKQPVYSHHQTVRLYLILVNFILFLSAYFGSFRLLSFFSKEIPINSGEILSILIIIPILSQSISYYGLFLLLNKVYYPSTIATIVSGFANIIFSIYFIKNYGITGAAIATVSSIAVEIFLYNVFGRLRFNVIFPKVEIAGLGFTFSAIFLLIKF